MPPAPSTDVLLDRLSERVGGVEGRLADLERAVTPLGDVMGRVDATLSRMDAREEQKWAWQQEQGRTLWRLLGQPVAIMLAAAAAYAAARFGVPMPIFPAADGASAPLAAPAEPGTGGAF